MNAEELEDLKIYSKIFNDDFTRISVLHSLLDSQIRQTSRTIKLFKEQVDEQVLKNTCQNH